MQQNAYEAVHQALRNAQVVVTQRQQGFTVFHRDLVTIHSTIVFCLQGTGRMLYNMREVVLQRNQICICRPGVAINQLECSDDFTFARVVIHKDMVAELRQVFPFTNYEQFLLTPVCTISDERAEYFMKIIDLLADICNYEEANTGVRHYLLLAQLVVGLEFIHFVFTHNASASNPNLELFNRFSHLVAEHYKEARETKFYAEQLHYTPRHFTKLIRDVVGITPAEWIEQYVIRCAKMYMANHPHMSISQIALQMGFDEPVNFYRYIKRVTGQTATLFRASISQ